MSVWLRKALVIVISLLMLVPAAAAPATEVMVIATMHKLHAASARYSYDALYALLRKVNPNFVGVEIRAEDIGSDAAYLARNYPAEMIETAKQWGPRAFGFDWLGDDIANAPVPADYWAKRSLVKQREREMSNDPAFASAALDAIQAQEMDILKNATAASLNDGRYDRLSDDYYRQFRKLVNGSKYQMLADFYEDRDKHIDSAIAAAIKAHPGARFAILTGADHRGPLIKYLKTTFGSDVILVPVP